VGPSGSGKTAMGLQFLREGVRAGEPSLLVALEENPVQIARVVDHFGWNSASLIGRGKLDILFCSPIELQIDTIIRELFGRLESDGVHRVVIDALGDLAYTADDPIRFRDYLFALSQQLATRNVTALFTVASSTPYTEEGISYVGDNLLFLETHLGDELTRTIRVLKTRGSAHDGRRHPVSIGSGGVMVK
jgi:circadian clock protein KaiC